MNRKQPFLRTAIAVLTLLMLVTTAFAAFTIPPHTDRFYVNDFAGVLSDATKEEIFNTSRAYDQSDGTQVVVTTIKTLNGASLEEYALEMARSWGVGGSEKNNGLLVLLALDERELRIEVGYGLEGVFNDAKAGRFMRKQSELFRADQWDEGVLNLYRDLLGELERPTPLDEPEDEGGIAEVVIAIVIVIIIIAIASRRGGGGGGYRRYPRNIYVGGRPPRGGFGGFGGGFGGGG
ncbi:MAG: TPM domain-containing protein, partial [Angelakisella sp.]